MHEHLADLLPGQGDALEALLDWLQAPGRTTTFRFVLSPLEDGRTRLRFWQHYAVELDDDYYGIYNFNWGYYLESLRLLCATGTGSPFRAAG